MKSRLKSLALTPDIARGEIGIFSKSALDLIDGVVNSG